MNETCHTCEWDVSHKWIKQRNVTHTNMSCCTYALVTSHHVTSHHVTSRTYKCDTSHFRIRRVTRMNASCQMYERDMSHIWMRHVTISHILCTCIIIHCNTLQHIATHCNTLQHNTWHVTMRHVTMTCHNEAHVCVAVCCSVLQCVAVSPN